MKQEPQEQHKWLEQLVGRWTYESECIMGPDQPPMKVAGKEVVRSFGGLWTIGEGEGGEGADAWKSIMTLGYDPQQERFVGTFVATMMAYLWVYSGQLDATGKVLTLDAEGPNMMDGSMAKYQDIIEIVSDSERTLRSQMLDSEGNWQQFLTTRYRRVG